MVTIHADSTSNDDDVAVRAGTNTIMDVTTVAADRPLPLTFVVEIHTPSVEQFVWALDAGSIHEDSDSPIAKRVRIEPRMQHPSILQ